MYKCPELTYLVQRLCHHVNLGKMEINIEEISESEFNCVKFYLEVGGIWQLLSGLRMGTLELKFPLFSRNVLITGSLFANICKVLQKHDIKKIK